MDCYDILIKKIVAREEGIGALLALGSAEAAKKLGKEAEDLVVASKGQEWPVHMVQFKPNLAVNYAVNPFGADHQSSEHDPALMAPDDLIAFCKVGAGWNVSIEELQEIGERRIL